MSDTSHAASPTRWQIPFFTIWTGQALSTLGSRVTMFALIWWLTESTGSATVLALATLFAMLPTIVLGPLTGVLVDRWNASRVMIAGRTGLIALLSVWIAVLFWTGGDSRSGTYTDDAGPRDRLGAFQLARPSAGHHLPMVPKQYTWPAINGVNQALNGGAEHRRPGGGGLLLSVTTPRATSCAGRDSRPCWRSLPLLFVAGAQPAPRRTGPGRLPCGSELREGAALRARLARALLI
jgi:DHA3 family macrolide efflux protein-like MFS transporter